MWYLHPISSNELLLEGRGKDRRIQKTILTVMVLFSQIILDRNIIEPKCANEVLLFELLVEQIRTEDAGSNQDQELQRELFG
jgi:hypothetical protein